MNENERIYEYLKREYDNLESLWTSMQAHNMRNSMKNTLDFIERLYQKGRAPKDIRTVIIDYVEHFVNTNKFKGINAERIFLRDEYEAFLKNPSIIWEVYDSEIDKKAFDKAERMQYSTDKKKNREKFVKSFWSVTLANVDVKGWNKVKRKEFAEIIVDKFKANSNVVKDENRRKPPLIKVILTLLNDLRITSNFTETIKNHNNNMKKIGLDFLSVSENTDEMIGEGTIFDIDLMQCSLLQLEALLVFYTNRLEKVFESVGAGLFLLEHVRRNKENGLSGDDFISNDALKEVWKKKCILGKIAETLMNGTYDELVKAEIPVTDELTDNIYSGLIEPYNYAYQKMFGANLEDDLAVSAHAFSKQANYLVKNKMVEGIIIEAFRNNYNWGLMEEDGEILIKKRVLIAIDIPGLNMPLRVHYELEKLRTLMKEYLETEEVPLYIGSEDFNLYGKNFGTQLMIPVTSQKATMIKNASKKLSDLPQDALNCQKHIACMQLPNTWKRLLTIKTGKNQVYPDYMNIFTKNIRRTERKTINSKAPSNRNR